MSGGHTGPGKTAPVDPLLREKALDARLALLKSKIQTWAEERELWDDAGFLVPFEHRNEPPSAEETLLLSVDSSGLFSLFRGDRSDGDALEEDLRNLIAAEGFESELFDHVTLSLWPSNEADQAEYLKLHRWRWIQSLAERRIYDLHAEVFEHFAADPGALARLHWRKYEEFLGSVFRNQGFRTELGPGGHDGGVDLRLYQSESIPEIVTVVQAKCYTDRPIGFEAVAALAMAGKIEGAERALFATTSRYQPAARNFAETSQSLLDIPTVTLTGPCEAREWCETIAGQLSAYFKSGDIAPPPIVRARPVTALTGKVVVAHWGYNITRNSFAIIEADYPHEVILRPLRGQRVSGDLMLGTEVADTTTAFDAPRILALKSKSGWNDEFDFWGGRKLYTLWDGAPQAYNGYD